MTDDAAQPGARKPYLRLGADSLGDYAAFTDESSISGHRYMLIGGVSCRSHYADTIHQRVLQIRAESEFPQDSLQWKHYRPRKHDAYKALVDLFLEENASHRLDLICLVVDTEALDHRQYNDGDGETFFQKAMYQIYVSIAMRYSANILRGFHGHRTSPVDMDDTRQIINSGIAKRRGSPIYRPLRQFDLMKVETSGLHQIADVMLGAISYYWNPGMRRGGQSNKSGLAEYIRKECCVSDLGKPTPQSSAHFDIWKMRLQARGPRT